MLAAARKHLAPSRRAVAVQAFSARSLPARSQRFSAGGVLPAANRGVARGFTTTPGRKNEGSDVVGRKPDEEERGEEDGVIPAEELTTVGAHEKEHEHAVISAFDLFSIGGARTNRRDGGGSCSCANDVWCG